MLPGGGWLSPEAGTDLGELGMLPSGWWLSLIVRLWWALVQEGDVDRRRT